jgi:hypothetical protein
MTSINSNRSPSRSPTTSTANTTKAQTAPPPDDGVCESLDGMSEELPTHEDRAVVSTPTTRSGATAATAAKALEQLVYVSDGDVARALDAFKGLPPGEAKAALESLQQSGSLSTLLKEADGAERRRLTDLLIETGMVGSTTPETPESKGVRGPLPPAPPTLPVPPKGASDELKAMLHDENIARAKEYVAEHGDYIKAYREAVRDSPTLTALRQLGPPTAPNLPLWEPGGRHTSDTTEWSTTTRVSPDTQTGKLITGKLYELRGESPPGVDTEISGAVKMAFGEHASVGANASYGEDRNGNTSATVGGSGGIAVGPEAARVNGNGAAGAKWENGELTSVTTSATGSVGGARKRESQPAGGEVADGASTTFSKDGIKQDVSLGVGAASIEFAKDKANAAVDVAGAKVGFAYEKGKVLTATLGAGGLAFTGGLAEHGAMTGEVELERKLKAGDVVIEVKVSAKQTVQLASVQDYQRFTAIIESGPFEKPAELQRNMKWADLSAGAREAYTLYGWSKNDWDIALQANQVSAMRTGGR